MHGTYISELFSAYFMQSVWDSFVMSHVHHFSLSSAVTIGFDAVAYTFNETDSTVSRSVSVSVQGSNTLARDVIVTVETMDDTATGEALSHTQTLYMCHSHFLSLQLHLTTQL